MMKIAIMVLLVLSFAIVLFLLYQSQKMLRAVQKQQAQEKSRQPPERQLHPKLLQEQKNRKSGH